MAKLHELRELLLGRNQLSDASLKHLTGLKKLRSLYLYGCSALTDAAVEHLVQLTALEDIDLRETGLSSEAIGKLHGGIAKLRHSRQLKCGCAAGISDQSPRLAASLADAEAAEDPVQHVVGRDGTAHLAQFVQRQPNFRRDQLFALAQVVEQTRPL